MKQAFLIFLLAIMVSCGTHKMHDSKNFNEKLVGQWTEHWGKDTTHPESDVTYVDTLTMALEKNGKLRFYCAHNPHYRYDQIDFDGKKLLFRMENLSDSSEKFYVNFFLEMTNENRFEGRIVNSKDQTVAISLQRYISKTK
jgi:hypothetical protein